MAELGRNPEELSSSTAGLLVSILIRYPEIGALHYDPALRALKFTFMVKREVDDAELDALRSTVIDSLEAYAVLTNSGPPEVAVGRVEYGDMTMIEVTRDIRTLNAGDIAILVSLLKERFGDDLASEPADPLAEEEAYVQDEYIEDLLDDMKISGIDKSLIGFRDSGRVVVFNKAARR